MYFDISVDALQQQNTADVSMPAAAAPTTSYFYPSKYTHHQQPFQYQSNQYLTHSHASAPYFPSPPGLETVYVWPPQQQQYATQPYATSFDHHRYQHSSDVFAHAKQLQHASQNGYPYDGFDRNGIYYGTQMSMAGGSSTVPTPSSSSGGCSEQNWPISSRTEHDSTPNVYDQNGIGSVDTNHQTSSFDVSTQNERGEISMLDVKNRALEIEQQEKKVPRPMNSFMIYAKCHRAQVHQLYPLCDNRTVSKILSDTWYAMDAEKKREYYALASEMRQEHFRLHPDFKWKPAHSDANEPSRKKSPNATTIAEPNAQPEKNRSAGDSNDTFPSFQFDECGDLLSSYMPTTPSTETSLSPVGCGGGGDDESKLSQAIHLAPTPAQLGLCRSKKRSKPSSSAAFASGINNDGPNGSSDAQAVVLNHPQFKQRFLNLPKFDFSNYRQSSEWDASPTSPAITYNTTMRKRKSDADQHQQAQQQHHQLQPAKRLIGNHFFGPDFNANHFKGEEFASIRNYVLYLAYLVYSFYILSSIQTRFGCKFTKFSVRHTKFVRSVNTQHTVLCRQCEVYKAKDARQQEAAIDDPTALSDHGTISKQRPVPIDTGYR